jgi:probable HAF family extracellular repeat protein
MKSTVGSSLSVLSITGAIAGAVCAAIAGTGTASEFYLLPVGPLAEGISDTGLVTGSFNVPEYFIWTVDGGVELIGGVIPGDGIGGQAKVSNDGKFICGGSIGPVSGASEMSRYDVESGTWTALGGLGSQSGAEVSGGWSISGDGSVVGGFAWTTPGGGHATIWSEANGIVDLGSTVPGQSSRLSALNGDGTVAAGWQDGNGRQGAVWVDGVQELIFKPGRVAVGEAFDVSGDGQWVTGIEYGGFFGAAEGYRYNSVTNQTDIIPNLVDGESRFGGAGITDDGATIVGGTWGFGPATFGTAIIWREGVGTVRFDDYLDSLGVKYPAGFNFAYATAVSSDGSWITGWGYSGSFANMQTWVVNLTADVPGGPRRRRRRRRCRSRSAAGRLGHAGRRPEQRRDDRRRRPRHPARRMGRVRVIEWVRRRHRG